jgi:hypothetical protein
MSEIIKIRLKTGNREIEVEGSSSKVDSLLEKWWKSSENGNDGRDDDERDSPPKEVPKGNARRGQSRSAVAPKDASNDSFNPQELVNKMRNDERYPKFEEKVLHARDRANKIKLVAWYSTDSLTSGDIHKVLTGLGVRIHLPGVSSVIKSHQRDFTQSATRSRGAKIHYELTGQAKKAFGEWLKKDE